MAGNAAGDRGAVVVTGASTGIGEACALQLDRMGFSVFAGVRREADGNALEQKASGRLTPVFIDVADEVSIASAVETVSAAVGEAGLAGLVNNAGIAVPAPIELVPLDALRRQLEVNVIGQVSVTQAFLPLVRKAQGRIVNMGSIAGRLAIPFLGPYCMSKFAMEAMTDSMRVELRPWGIKVSLVEPGRIATPIWGKGITTGRGLMKDRPNTLYGPLAAAIEGAVSKADGRGIHPDKVAEVVAHALTSRRPKTRYLVGLDAHIQATLANLVPDWLLDGLIMRQMGLRRRR